MLMDPASCHFKLPVCSIENSFPWGTIFCWGLLRGFCWFFFFKVNFASTRKELSRIKLPVYYASNIVNQFQLNDCEVPLKWLNVVWSGLLLIASRRYKWHEKTILCTSKCRFDHIQLSSLQEKDLFSEGYRVKVLCW